MLKSIDIWDHDWKRTLTMRRKYWRNIGLARDDEEEERDLEVVGNIFVFFFPTVSDLRLIKKISLRLYFGFRDLISSLPPHSNASFFSFFPLRYAFDTKPFHNLHYIPVEWLVVQNSGCFLCTKRRKKRLVAMHTVFTFNF